MEYNLQNYKQAIAEVEKEKEEKIKKIIREYALANNTVKIGDVVEGSSDVIIVEKINFVRPYPYNELPTCAYFGARLKKDGTPRKDKSKGYTYQSNLKK
jgi:hypothetical protein